MEIGVEILTDMQQTGAKTDEETSLISTDRHNNSLVPGRQKGGWPYPMNEKAKIVNTYKIRLVVYQLDSAIQSLCTGTRNENPNTILRFVDSTPQNFMFNPPPPHLLSSKPPYLSPSIMQVVHENNLNLTKCLGMSVLMYFSDVV